MFQIFAQSHRIFNNLYEFLVVKTFINQGLAGGIVKEFSRFRTS